MFSKKESSCMHDFRDYTAVFGDYYFYHKLSHVLCCSKSLFFDLPWRMLVYLAVGVLFLAILIVAVSATCPVCFYVGFFGYFEWFDFILFLCGLDNLIFFFSLYLIFL